MIWTLLAVPALFIYGLVFWICAQYMWSNGSMQYLLAFGALFLLGGAVGHYREKVK
jgi:hypothetical protein